MKSSNTQGNPYHDESGKFTSGEGGSGSAKSEKKPYAPKKGPTPFASDWLNSLYGDIQSGESEGAKAERELIEMLKKMNGEDEETEAKAEPKVDDRYTKISEELEKGDWVNIDAGLVPSDYGFDLNDSGYSGYEDLAVDAKKVGDKYNIYMYPETENGPVEDPEEAYPTYSFDTFEEMKEFIESDYGRAEKKLGEMGFKGE